MLVHSEYLLLNLLRIYLILLLFSLNSHQPDNKTREPLSKGDSRTGLIAFHIQLPLATLASLAHFILHTSE